MSADNGKPLAPTDEVMREAARRAGYDTIEPDEQGGLDAAIGNGNAPVGYGKTPLPSAIPATRILEPKPAMAKPQTPLRPRGSATLHRCDIGTMLATEPEPIDWLATGVVARGYRNGPREIHRRVRALGLTTATGLVIYEGVAFSLASGLDELDSVLADTKPDLLWLDSWRSMWSGDENSAQEASQVLDPLRELIRRHNVGAGLLHHANKLGQYRGSTAVGASVENIVEFTKADDDDDRRRRRLRNTACRFEQEADDRWVRIEADRARGLVLIDEAKPFVPSQGGRPRERDGTAADLLEALDGEFTPWPDWARAAGLDPQDRTARRARDDLADRGLVVGAQGLWKKGNPQEDA